MREKGKQVKSKKILIRVNSDEKKLAEEISHARGMNTSEFFRNMLYEAQKNKFLDIHVKIVEKYRKTLAEYKTVLDKASRKRKR